MRQQQPVFSKEKAVFIAVAGICAIAAYSFLASRPLELMPTQQLASSKKDPARLTALPADVLAEMNYFQGERKSPFVPFKKEITKGVLPPKPPGPGGTGGGGTAGTKGTLPVDFSLYTFSGIVIHEGSGHALLQTPKGTTIRVEEGKAVNGGYVVERVNKQSIEFRHSSGQVYLVSDRASQ